MKVILYYDYLSEIGGVERVIATHARWLRQAGHEVTLLFNYVSDEARKYKFFDGLDIQELSSLKKGSEPTKVFSALFGFNKINQYNPDLVICYSFPSLYVARKLKCPKAFYYLPMEFIYFPVKKRWEWANDGKRKAAFFGSFIAGPVLKMLDKKWIKNKLVIANSDFTRREIEERYHLPSIISYPPLNDVFKPSKGSKTLDKYGIKKPFAMTAGRIIPDKKTDWLLEVFAKLGKKDWDFVVAGGIEEGYKQQLLTKAKSLGIDKQVKLIGLVQQTELVDLYSETEIFLFASPLEAFGLVPIEAMACGTPVVAWDDAAGPNEYVINDVNGLRAKPYDLNDFVEKAKQLIDSNFKKKNKKKIVDSVKKFSEKEQYNSFKDAVENWAKTI